MNITWRMLLNVHRTLTVMHWYFSESFLRKKSNDRSTQQHMRENYFCAPSFESINAPNYVKVYTQKRLPTYISNSRSSSTTVITPSRSLGAVDDPKQAWMKGLLLVENRMLPVDDDGLGFPDSSHAPPLLSFRGAACPFSVVVFRMFDELFDCTGIQCGSERFTRRRYWNLYSRTTTMCWRIIMINFLS